MDLKSDVAVIKVEAKGLPQAKMADSASYKHGAQCKSPQVTNVPHLVTAKRTLIDMSHLGKVLFLRNMRSGRRVLGCGQHSALESASRFRLTARDDLEQLTYVPVTGD